MKTATALRHVSFEHLGSWHGLLEERGIRIDYVDAATADLGALDATAPDLFVVLGGPIGAFEEDRYPFLLDELRLIRQRLASGKPLLGICLGAQLIARTCGAEVLPMARKEIGFAPLTFTGAGRTSPLGQLGNVPVLHWHGDQFALPDGADLLASSDLCANQAFALGPNALALQCHLEADVAELEHWLVGHASELADAKIDIPLMRSDARLYGESLTQRAGLVLADWLDRLENLQ